MYRSACMRASTAPTEYAVLVGARLARDENNPVYLMYRSACIAGKPRSNRSPIPWERACSRRQWGTQQIQRGKFTQQVGFQAASRAFDLAFDLRRPVKPRWPEFDIDSAVQTGMDAGLAALGQGWPFAAARRINVGLRACRA